MHSQLKISAMAFTFALLGLTLATRARRMG